MIFIMKINPKKLFYSFIHIFFITGILYAFYHFALTPKRVMEIRRMWAYESWIILSFYCLFIFLILIEQDRLKAIKDKFIFFKNILSINLILLVFPWGLFLILAPHDLLTILRLSSYYWRILGIMSILGSVLYYFPYKFYKNKLTYYILLFGCVDNFLAGIIVGFLFFSEKIPLIAFASAPLLFYFSYFFFEQFKQYRRVKIELKNQV